MLPTQVLTGDDTALSYGLFATASVRRVAFESFLLNNGFADTPGRASAIWTQAREYYYSDTGTVTSRPQRTAVNRFTSESLQGEGFIPFFTSVSEVLKWNEAYPDTELSPRYSSGSSDPSFCQEYIIDGGLLGLAVIVCEGSFSFVWVAKNSQ